MSRSPSNGVPIQTTPVPRRSKPWWRGIIAFAIAFGGRLFVFGGLTLLLVLAGVLAGVWSYADDERLPGLIEDSLLFQPYVEALDQRRRQAVDTRSEIQEWRAEVTERLRLLGNSQRQVKGSASEILAAVQSLESAVVHSANYQWCGGLRLHGLWSDECAELVAQGDLQAAYEFTEAESKGDP